MSAYNTSTEDCTAVPARAVSIGVDGEGATHYLGNRIVHDEALPVFVEESTGEGEVEVYDLAETPCWSADDEVEAWIEHVEAKRDGWESETYDEGLVEQLGGRVEVDR